MSDEMRWFEIYDIIFPNQDPGHRPLTPCTIGHFLSSRPDTRRAIPTLKMLMFQMHRPSTFDKPNVGDFQCPSFYHHLSLPGQLYGAI